MPISFACECGKPLKVADEHAGKRAKCPSCGNPVQVPALPAAAPEPASDEDAAFRALADGPDEPPPAARDWREAGPTVPPSPRPPVSFPPKPPEKKEPPKPKGKPQRDRDPYAERGRKWTVDWGQIGGGIVGMLLGGGLILLGREAGRFPIWAVVLILGGAFGVLNGLFNVSRE